MQIQLNVNGYFDIDFFYLNGNKVGEHKDEDILQGILDNLQMNEYVIGIESRKVYDINDLTKPLYTFELSATDSVEYDFEEIEEEIEPLDLEEGVETKWGTITMKHAMLDTDGTNLVDGIEIRLDGNLIGEAIGYTSSSICFENINEVEKFVEKHCNF